jgi:hypothetical protein
MEERKFEDNYADALSGDWSEVPDWVIRRLNFLEEIAEFYDRSRCPLLDDICPRFKDDIEEDQLTCRTVKHCYSHLCDCSCGKCNEIWLSDKEIKEVNERRKEVYG